MRQIKKIAFSILAAGLIAGTSYAGNPDRSGQAGATQLLVNPWARSSGWGGTNMAGMSGVEAMNFNVAGMVAIPQRMEFSFSHANWLSGAGISINSFGMVQMLGDAKSNAFGLSIMAFDFGDIPQTTTAQPEGVGSYSIQMLNIGLAYSHKFSDNINGGVLVRTLSEGVFNAKAQGIALDAGIQYKAGKQDRIKFGVALRNVGPTMKYSGDGLSTRAIIEGADFSQTLEARTSDFELPSVLSIGGTYDIFFDTTYDRVLTLAGSFTSNAFAKDQFGLGAQLSLFRKILFIRGGYVFEPGLLKDDTRSTALMGPSAGLSINIPFGKDKSKRVALDYSYRFTAPFGGTHTYGLRVNL